MMNDGWQYGEVLSVGAKVLYKKMNSGYIKRTRVFEGFGRMRTEEPGIQGFLFP